MPKSEFPLYFEEEGIFFHFEEVDFDFPNAAFISAWLETIIEKEGKSLRLLHFIFCSDPYLHTINLKHLHHDTFTDIITFPYAEPPLIEGDIFISIDRIRENARQFEVSFENELCRVMAHGVFHLCGYGDKKPEEAILMRQKEREALKLLATSF